MGEGRPVISRGWPGHWIGCYGLLQVMLKLSPGHGRSTKACQVLGLLLAVDERHPGLLTGMNQGGEADF